LLREIEDHQDRLMAVTEAAEPDDELALRTAELFEQYIREYPVDTTRVPEFYYEGARLYALSGAYEKAIPMVDTFRAKYPEHHLAPVLLHMKGFLIYETGMQDYDNARRTYEAFIQTYPEHPMVADVLFSLENLGKSDEEIMEEIIRRSQSKGDQDSTSAD
jgi:outer membrane protein assembly factor BamD (BamD/ComL family)